MSHFFLSRFNARPSDPLQRKKNLWLNEEWLESRLDLSRRFFRPSLENQTRKDFLTVVALDKQTPAEIVRFFKEFSSVFFGQIQDYPFPPRAITTRLDSDDAICSRFVEKIYELFTKAGKRETPVLVDWDTAQLNVSTGEIFKVDRPANNSQFVSVINSTKKAFCYSTAHTNMPQLFAKQHRFNEIGGLQTVHGSNILTKIPKGKKIKLDLKDYLGEISNH